MPKMLAFIDGSIYSDSVCDHVIWAAADDEFVLKERDYSEDGGIMIGVW